MKKNFLILTLFFYCLSCANPTIVNIIGPNDNKLSCKELSAEIAKANQYADEAKEAKKMDKPHNIGAILFFLPGYGVTLIVSEGNPPDYFLVPDLINMDHKKAEKLLEDVGIEVGSRVVEIHDVKDGNPIPDGISPNQLSEIADASPVRCLDKDGEASMMQTIDDAKKAGDSVGGIFEVIATGLPYGLGAYTQWDRKLHTRISAMMMSVNAFKGIEIGGGFGGAEKFGSEVHDEIGHDGEKFIRYSNNAGGIEGGMSNAQPIVLRMAMKPIPTLIKPLRSVDIHSKESKDAHKERTDSCAVPAASIIAESMLCFVLADALLEKFGGDSMDQLRAHMRATAKY